MSIEANYGAYEAEIKRRDATDKAISQIPEMVDLLAEFWQEIRECAALRAQESATGKCEIHRHGRKVWEEK